MAFPGDYSKYQEVTIDNTQVSADLTDFVVYVDLSDLDKAGADIFDTCRTDGGDIRVTKNDGTTQLAREVVSIDTTGKTGELHFKFTGTLSSSSDTTVRIWYNGTDTEPAVTATYGRNNVWSDYVAVYHLNESVNNDTDGYTDSTGNNPGTGVSMALTEVTGQIATAQDFDGTNDHILISDSASLDEPNNNNAITLSAWVKKDSTGGTPQEYIVNKGINRYGIIHGFTTNLFEFFASGGVRFNIGTVSNTNWNHLVSTFNGATNSANGYLNATQSSASEGSDLPSANTSDAVIGGGLTATPSFANAFDGKIDEARVRSDALSSDWITTEYNNQNSPSTFYTTGDEVDTGGGVTRRIFVVT